MSFKGSTSDAGKSRFQGSKSSKKNLILSWKERKMWKKLHSLREVLQCHGPASSINLSPYIDEFLVITGNNYKLVDQRFTVITLSLSVMESDVQRHLVNA